MRETMNEKRKRAAAVPSPPARSHKFAERLWNAVLVLAFMVASLQFVLLHPSPSDGGGGKAASMAKRLSRRDKISRPKEGSVLKRSSKTELSATKDVVDRDTRDNRPINKKHSPRLDPTASATTTIQVPSPRYHVVFSSSCTDQQDWESWVLFYHAWKVGQPGNVTRIVSGCPPDRAAKLQEHHDAYVRQLSPHFHLHLTPDFSRLHLERGTHPYKYMNKPYGLRHWMENALNLTNETIHSSPYKDDIVILMDPDMVLLRPLVHDWRNRTDVMWSLHRRTNSTISELDKVVRPGHPIAQHDGYLSSEWMKFPPAYDNGTQLQRPKVWDDGTVYYNSGPPYMAVVSDMYRLAKRWTVWAPRVLEIHPQLFAEMHGLIWAAVELNMPFALARSFVVSEPATKSREGWSHVDAVQPGDVCDYNVAHPPLPVVLHYCKRYMLGEWFFSKYRLKKNILSCDKSLLKLPPRNVHILDYADPPPRDDGKPSGEARLTYEPSRSHREAYMMCHMMSAVNEAVRHFKQLACPGGGNVNETYTIHADPSAY